MSDESKFKFVNWERETIHWDWNKELKVWVCQETGQVRSQAQMDHYKGTFHKVEEI